MANEALGNSLNTFLFDRYDRTDRSGGSHAETSFQLFNCSARPSVEIVRRTLESWFADIPQKNRADLRSRFRGDNRSHSSALLELATHKILHTLLKEVQVGPDFDGGHPDFSAIYRDTRFIVECTVVQESDKNFGALQREQIVLDAINSIRPGPFGLELEPRAVGMTQPPTKRLRRCLERWLESVAPQSQSASVQVESPFASREWRCEDWELHFEAIPLDSQVDGGAIVVIRSPVREIRDHHSIARALEKKAERYRQPRVPYLIVLAQRESPAEETVILDALLGREVWMVHGHRASVGPRQFDGFWGSRSQPARRHVSAVLYKRIMSDAWSICSQRTGYDPPDFTPHPIPEWHMVHNPFADMPLPHGLFPFATEHVWKSEQQELIHPTRTLNEVLDLPDPWPGEEH